MPHQLLQSLRFLFFGSAMITPFVQSMGTSFNCQILFSISVKCAISVSPPHLSSSQEISSSPGALLFCRHLTTMCTLPGVILPILTSSGVPASNSSIKIGGMGWFSTSLKCSAQCAFCSSSVVKVLPSLLFIGAPGTLLLFTISHVMWYSDLASFLFAAACASSSFFLSHCSFSLWHLFLTVLFRSS